MASLLSTTEPLVRVVVERLAAHLHAKESVEDLMAVVYAGEAVVPPVRVSKAPTPAPSQAGDSVALANCTETISGKPCTRQAMKGQTICTQCKRSKAAKAAKALKDAKEGKKLAEEPTLQRVFQTEPVDTTKKVEAWLDTVPPPLPVPVEGSDALRDARTGFVYHEEDGKPVATEREGAPLTEADKEEAVAAGFAVKAEEPEPKQADISKTEEPVGGAPSGLETIKTILQAAEPEPEPPKQDLAEETKKHEEAAKAAKAAAAAAKAKATKAANAAAKAAADAPVQPPAQPKLKCPDCGHDDPAMPGSTVCAACGSMMEPTASAAAPAPAAAPKAPAGRKKLPAVAPPPPVLAVPVPPEVAAQQALAAAPRKLSAPKVPNPTL